MTHPNQPDRLIVGVTGATGIVYGARALDILRSVGIETHLIVTSAAGLTRTYETDLSRHDLDSRADYVYNIHDVGAPMSSGSFLTPGMLIAPRLCAASARSPAASQAHCFLGLPMWCSKSAAASS